NPRLEPVTMAILSVSSKSIGCAHCKAVSICYTLAVIGTTLGPHRITAKLGEGSMGEVYRARDTKLGRDVAIKVLSRDVAGDPDRIARLEREARLLAAVNHP